MTTTTTKKQAAANQEQADQSVLDKAQEHIESGIESVSESITDPTVLTAASLAIGAGNMAMLYGMDESVTETIAESLFGIDPASLNF